MLKYTNNRGSITPKSKPAPKNIHLVKIAVQLLKAKYEENLRKIYQFETQMRARNISSKTRVKDYYERMITTNFLAVLEFIEDLKADEELAGSEEFERAFKNGVLKSFRNHVEKIVDCELLKTALKGIWFKRESIRNTYVRGHRYETSPERIAEEQSSQQLSSQFLRMGLSEIERIIEYEDKKYQEVDLNAIIEVLSDNFKKELKARKDSEQTWVQLLNASYRDGCLQSLA